MKGGVKKKDCVYTLKSRKLEELKQEKEKRDEDERMKAALKEYQAKEAAAAAKKKKEKEEDEERAREKMRDMLRANGYTEEEIDRILEKAGKKSEHSHSHTYTHTETTTKVLAKVPPTYMKIKREYIEPDTLDVYQLPWEFDAQDPLYIIIKQHVNDDDLEALFAHTAKLRQPKVVKEITYTSATELRKRDNKLLLVRDKKQRSKSPARSIFFT